MSATTPEFAIIAIRSSWASIYQHTRDSGTSIISAIFITIFIRLREKDALVSVPRERLDAVLNSDIADELRADGFIVEPVYPWGGEPATEKLSLRDAWDTVRYGDRRE